MADEIKTAIVIGSGSVDGVEGHLTAFQGSPVYCADGGVDNALALGLEPNSVFGDFDSISEAARQWTIDEGIPILQFPVEKDKSDMELVWDHLLQEGYQEAIVLGATGTRLDHTLSNLLMLPKYFEKGLQLTLLDGHNSIQPLGDQTKIRGDENYISLVPLTAEGLVVSLSGFQFPLNRENIPFGSSLGISNRVIGDEGTIQLHRGCGLLFYSVD